MLKAPISLTTTFSLLAALAITPMLLADEPAPKPDKPARPAVSNDPLAGPAVKKTQKKPSIVERDMQGKVVRLEITPPEAAVKIIKLDDETRKKVDAILVQQAAAMDVIVRDNIETIAAAANAFQSGDKTAGAAALKQLWDKSGPVRARGRLIEQLANVLPDDKARELRAMVGEYYEQRLADEEAAAKAKGERMATARFTLDEQLFVLGHDIKRSYERVFGQNAKEFDDLLKSLNLTPEQDAKVRQIFTDNFQKYKGKPTDAANAEAFLKAWTVLDTEQRKALFEKMKERGLDATKKRTTPKSDKPAKPAEPAAPADPMKETPPQ